MPVWLIPIIESLIPHLLDLLIGHHSDQATQATTMGVDSTDSTAKAAKYQAARALI